jgi:hypothetical protein
MYGRVIRFITEKLAAKSKIEFIKKFNLLWVNTIRHSVDFNVISFSGSKQFADQLFSISSFYRNVGRPFSWIVYNDGSYSHEELLLLRSINGVKVCNIEIGIGSLPQIYFKQFPTLLKIEILRQQVDFNKTLLFADSDILFYSKFKDYFNQFSNNNWYIIDEGKGYFDPEFVLPENQLPLNLGFLVLNNLANWDFVLDYLHQKINKSDLHYWSDQTATHILAQNEQFNIMPKEHFKVGGNDSFKYSHDVNYNEIAVRHFVGPIRHKMWQYSWKKVLRL